LDLTKGLLWKILKGMPSKILNKLKGRNLCQLRMRDKNYNSSKTSNKQYKNSNREEMSSKWQQAKELN
jgi:hypothetical protein